MGIYDAIRDYNGVITYLSKNADKVNIGKPKKKTHRAQDEHLNNLIIEFGKANNLEMEKNNSPRYKGSYNPLMSNCQTVQANWRLFKKWLFANYPITTITNIYH